MSRIDHDVSSVTSSLQSDIHSQEEPVQYQPSAVNEPSSRRPSMIRRLSNSASSFFNASSITQESLVEDVEDDILDIGNENYVEEMFGAKQLSHAMTSKSSDEEEQTPQPYTGQQPQQQESSTGSQESKADLAGDSTTPPPQQPVQRRKGSIVSAFSNKKYSFWDKEFKSERIKIAMQVLENYVYLVLGFAAVLCIYTGSYYNRTSRFKNLKMAIMIGDRNSTQLPNIVGQTIEGYFTKVPALQALGNFDIWDYDRLSNLATSHNNTLTEEVYRQIHHQKYWAAFYVYENATLNWYQALASGSKTFNPTNSLMEVVYETGRDYNAVNNYIVTIIGQILRGYYKFIPQSGLVANMLKTLNSTQANNVINNAPQLISTIPTFSIHDLHPVPNPVFSATMQLAGVYLIVLTFFAFVFSIQIQMYIASKVKGIKYVIFRMMSNQVAYFIISLAFVVLNTAFGLPFNGTFGHAGFLVIWVFSYLLMSAIGSVIEFFVLIVFALKPPMIGFVLLFTVVLNLAPTISPIILCPKFYRYGYAMPLKNFYDLLQVAYFNAWKGHMGRNIGILFAWMVVSNAALPFVMKWLANKKAKAEEQKANLEESQDNKNNQVTEKK